GVAAALALSGWTGALLLLVALGQRRWIDIARDSSRRIGGIVGAAFLMAIVVVGLSALQDAEFGPLRSFAGQVVSLAILISAGVVVYLAALWQFGIADIRDLLAQLRGRS